jgi:hypothetical protein
MKHRMMLFSPDGDANGAPAGAAPQQQGASQGGSQGGSRTEVRYVDANVESIIARHGGVNATVRHFFRDNKKARDARREAERQRDQALEAAKLKPGEVKLTGDDAKAWEAYKALGKKPEELTAIITEHGTLKGTVEATTRKTVTQTAAQAVGYNPDALTDLVETKGLKLILKKEQVNGQEQEMPYVQQEGKDPVALKAFAESNLSLYLPALTAAPSAAQQQQGATGATGDARRTPYPAQSSSGITPPAGNGTDAAPPLRDKRVLPSQRNAKPTETKA